MESSKGNHVIFKNNYLGRSTIDMLERSAETESQNVSLKEEYNFIIVK